MMSVSCPIYLGFQDVPLTDTPVHLAIGMFDGVHRGHQSVIQTANALAQEAPRGLSGVLTFSPHPSRVLRPDNPTPLIMPDPQKELFLKSLGIDFIIKHPFDLTFAQIQAQDFLPCIKGFVPKLASVHVGENFRFGKGRQGDVDFLKAEGKKLNIKVIALKRLYYKDEAISSTRIREMLMRGQLEDANVMLGYRYFSSSVYENAQTKANFYFFSWDPDLKPKSGIYVVKLFSKNAVYAHEGVAYYGDCPEISKSQKPCLMVHLMDQKIILKPQQDVKIEWLSYLGGDCSYTSIQTIKNHLEQHIQKSKMIFETY